MIHATSSIRRFLQFAPSLLLLAFATAPALAQAPTPGPEHAHLKKMEGEWTAKVKMGDEVSDATATSKMECGGLWLVSSFKGMMMGQKFEGRGMDSYDPESKKYVSVWVDSMTSKPLTLEGTYDKETKTLTMIGEIATPNGPSKARFVTKHKDDDHYTFSIRPLEGDDTPVLTIEYTRKK